MLDFSYGDGENCDQVKLFIDRWFTPLNPPLASRAVSFSNFSCAKILNEDIKSDSTAKNSTLNFIES
jgi:hypothetical protein